MAVLSSLFIALVAGTGIILSFEPIQREIHFAQSGADVTVSEFLSLLSIYEEVNEVRIDEYGHTIASLSHEEFDGDFYINPHTGTILKEVPKQKELFSFATKLHRSLFLKSTGRIIVAIVSFFLLLLTVSGLFLVLKRLQGITNFFNRINRSNIKEADYHAILGRLQLIPILIITITGLLLSFIRFDIIEDTQGDTIEYKYNEAQQRLELTEIHLFKKTRLGEVDGIEFPFSEDEEDYYYISIAGTKYTIHQYTGQILKTELASSTYQLKSLSVLLHTGRGSVWWSLVLGLACLGIFYFIYSGFVISYKRLSSGVKNTVDADEAKYILLYGSENGHTKKLANVFLKEMQRQKLSIHMIPMNEYRSFHSVEHIIIMTATYGDGEAPANASKFIQKLQDVELNRPVDFAVLGFGSLSYKLYCQFAKDVSRALHNMADMSPQIETHFINNSNFNDYRNWARKWGGVNNVNIHLEAPKHKIPRQSTFEVLGVDRVDISYESTFTLELKSLGKANFQSGDLLAIYPKKEGLKRLYSIGRINDNILLSVKLHKQGVCSQYLASLNVSDTLKAVIERNKKFHYPKNKDVIMIANGTGIAPFLGMIHKHTQKENILFWGGRNRSGYTLYEPQINTALAEETLDKLYITFSRERQQQYVEDLVQIEMTMILEKLSKGGVLMLCGSVAMQNAIFELLSKELKEIGMKPFEFYKANGQVLTDCY